MTCEFLFGGLVRGRRKRKGGGERGEGKERERGEEMKRRRKGARE